MTLQFDTAVPSGTPAANCAACKKPVGEVYYTVGKAVVCNACKTRIETARPQQTPPLLVARAAVCGVGGALAGAALYWVVLSATHAMIGYVAIAVAFFVGRAMQFGSGGRRGLPFQVVAVALTYCGIALGYSLAGDYGFVLAAPVRETIDHLPYSLIRGVIIAIGLWYAWVMNRPALVPTFHGPFKIGARA